MVYMTIEETGLPPEDFEPPTEEVVEVQAPMEKIRRWATKDWSMAKKKRKATELRLMGYSHRAIGRLMGVSYSSACIYVNSALESTYQEPAEKLKKLEFERFDCLIKANWRKAMTGDKDAGKLVIDSIMKRAKLLGMIDNVKIEATGAGIQSIRDMLGAMDVSEPSDEA
jgi:hypothetical protein